MSESSSLSAVFEEQSDCVLSASIPHEILRPTSPSSTIQPVSPSVRVLPIEHVAAPSSSAPTQEDIALNLLFSGSDVYETPVSSPRIVGENLSPSYQPTSMQDALLADTLANSVPVLEFSSQQTGYIDNISALVSLEDVSTTTLASMHGKNAVYSGSCGVAPPEIEITTAKDENVHSRASSPPTLNDDGSEDNGHLLASRDVEEPTRPTKRKRRAPIAEEDDEEADVLEVVAPRSKKMKIQKDTEPIDIAPLAKTKKTVVPKKKTPAKTEPEKDRVVKSKLVPKNIGRRGKTWYELDHGRQLDTLGRQEQKRLMEAQNPHIKKLKSWDFIKVTQGEATVKDHLNNVEKAKVQIKYIASALGPDNNPNRDLGGKTNKFDREDANVALSKDIIGAWKGSKWQDEQDENMTWFRIPAKQKTLSLAGRMVPMAEIIKKSAKFSEFTLMRKEMTKNPKTGKKEVGFYTVTYEKLEPEQAVARGEVLIRQIKAEVAQRKKDEAAELRREARGGAASKRKARA